MEQQCCKKLLEQKLFYNACRHHIYEFIIGAVYACLFGDSSAPDDANFKCFQAEWPKIDLSKDYHILEISSEWLKEKSKLVICELQQIIEKEKATKKAFVKGDYRQYVENTLALLGSAPSIFFLSQTWRYFQRPMDGQSVIPPKNVHVGRSNVL